MAAVPPEIALPPIAAESTSALRSAVTGFDREQLLWCSGYLAGMAVANPAAGHAALRPTVESGASNTWCVFFATETGNSRRVAETLAAKARQAGLTVELYDIREYRPKALANVANAVFVVATHGIGEAPDGSELFFEFWHSEKAPSLKKLNYSVLALGDSSYADFCEMGKLFDQRLQALGATAVVNRIDCDLDFDGPAVAWADQLVQYASERSDEVVSIRGAHLHAVTEPPVFARERPFNAEVLSTQRITGNGSSKDVQHVELSLAGSGLGYLPGDSLGVLPQNPAELVDALLAALRLEGTETVTADGNSVSLCVALMQYKEITVLNRPFLESVATEHKKLRKTLDDRHELGRFFNSQQVIDVVAEYPKDWQAQEFVDSLRSLTPRLYSIASSADANPDEAHLTIAVVCYEAHGRRHWGSASNYLISGVNEVPVYIEPNDHFRLPATPDTPIIMIGAGTGVAPYRAFVEHRREHGHTGDNWLIFGDRTLSSDFLYQLEWLRYRKQGALKRLDVAFSRDQPHKVYVQQRMLEQSTRIYSWLERGAHLYVCGDAQKMAVDVHHALLSVLQTAGGWSDERASAYLAELKAAQRYQRDVY